MSDTSQPQPSANLAHLHPDQVRVGRAGIFTLDANYTANTAGEMRLPVGFTGVLIDVWNGWAVFRCTRDVADAIVADQQRARDTERARLAAETYTPPGFPKTRSIRQSRVWTIGRSTRDQRHVRAFDHDPRARNACSLV